MFKVTNTRNKPPRNIICFTTYNMIHEREDILKCNSDYTKYREDMRCLEIENNMKIDTANRGYWKKNSSTDYSNLILIHESNEYMKKLGWKDRTREWASFVKNNRGMGRDEINVNRIFSKDYPDFFKRRSILIRQILDRYHSLSSILVDIHKNLKKIHVCEEALRFFIELNFDTSINNEYDDKYITDMYSFYERLRIRMIQIINEKNKDRSNTSSSFLH